VIVLDTNVVSELMKPQPSPAVLAWVGSRDRLELHTTSVTQAEILDGVLQLPAGRRRRGVEGAAEALFQEDFAGRILPFDSRAARPYADIVAERRRRGRPISQFDAQIGAIARAADATLVTRNVKDFEHCGIRVLNPWAER
jgi:predicted nucleic acid-binding protein